MKTIQNHKNPPQSLIKLFIYHHEEYPIIKIEHIDLFLQVSILSCYQKQRTQ